MTTLVRCVLLLGWLAVGFAPAITRAETLRIATIDYCPFTCDPTKENGKEGLMMDVLREAFGQAGYTLEIQMLPYIRAVDAVRNGSFDGIAVVGKTYAPDFVYPDEPTILQRVVFLVNTGNSWRYTGVESLSQALVGIVEGYRYVDLGLIRYFEKEQDNETRVYVLHGQSTTRRGLRMLRSNHITTFLEGEYSAMYEARKMGIADSVMIAGATTTAFEDYSGFSPRDPNAALHARILSDAIAGMKQSGRLNSILRRYGIAPLSLP